MLRSENLRQRQEMHDVVRITLLILAAMILTACATARPKIDKEAVDDFVSVRGLEEVDKIRTDTSEGYYELNDYYGSLGHPTYRWTVNENAPLHRLDKGVSESTVSLLTSGGVSQLCAAPFDPKNP